MVIFAKLVIIPEIEGVKSGEEETIKKAVIGEVKKNNPYCYSDSIRDLWKYYSSNDKRKPEDVIGLRLTYDENEGGFVGYIPILTDKKYPATICMTMGYNTKTYDYVIEAENGITKVSGDDKVLYESEAITASSDLIHFRIDVTGVHQLVIESVTDESNTGPSVAIVNNAVCLE